MSTAAATPSPTPLEIPPAPPPAQAAPAPAQAAPPPGLASQSPPTLNERLWDAWEEHRALSAVAVIAALAVVALLAWLVFLRPGGSDEVRAGGGPVETSPAGLTSLSQALGHELYWAGTMPGTKLEVTLTSERLVFVRYLSASAPIGDPSARYPVVGTYPAPAAYTDLRRYANRHDAVTRAVPRGGLAMVVPGSPTSVFVAYPGATAQAEIYDPHLGEALALARSGAIRPVP